MPLTVYILRVCIMLVVFVLLASGNTSVNDYAHLSTSLRSDYIDDGWLRRLRAHHGYKQSHMFHFHLFWCCLHWFVAR